MFGLGFDKWSKTVGGCVSLFEVAQLCERLSDSVIRWAREGVID